jgi:hypothetical protein
MEIPSIELNNILIPNYVERMEKLSDVLLLGLEMYEQMTFK